MVLQKLAGIPWCILETKSGFVGIVKLYRYVYFFKSQMQEYF